MSLERSRNPFLNDVGSNVEVLELRVASVGIDDERVLLDNALLFLLFGLARLEPEKMKQG